MSLEKEKMFSEFDLAFESDQSVADFVGEFDAGDDGCDYRELGLEPEAATPAKPGSEAKVLMLAARYAAGLPLWHDSDCYDHSPGGAAALLVNPAESTS